MDKMVVMKSWLEKIKKRTTPEQYMEVCAKILDYGIFEEFHESSDNLVNSHLDWLFPQIDLMQEKNDKMVEKGKRGGRPSDKNHAEIWKMFNVRGMKGAEIAAELGIPTTTLYSTEGWKNRKNPHYLEELEHENFS